MPGPAQSREALRLDERNHVEKPPVDQLAGLGWEIIDLTDMKADPGRHPSGGYCQVNRFGA